MRGRTKLLVGISGVLLAALSARAQTAVWTGGGGTNTNFSNGANWMSGSPPPSDGTNTVDLNEASDATIVVNTPANIAGIVFQGPPEGSSQYYINDGGGSLTIGSGGISFATISGASLIFDANVVLSQNQTWSLGFVYQEGGVISGPGSLTTEGSLYYMFGNNTFTGGLNVQSGTFYVGSGSSAGTGTVTLSDNVGFDTYFGTDSLANPFVVGNNVTFSTGVTDPLTLTGPVTFTNPTTNIQLGSGTILYLTGAVGGPSSTNLTFTDIGGFGSIQPVGGGSQVVLEGTLNQVTSLTISGTQVILAPTGNPTSALSSLDPSGVIVGVTDTSIGYLGLDGTFATTSGAVSSFISTYGASLGASIAGTLGFDTVASPGSPQTFSDPVNLSLFTSPSFFGLGSATSAILSGNITPAPYGDGGTAYLFGGGGGTLTITSDLEDYSDGGTDLVMTNATTPVTVILQGANNYTGIIRSVGGVLILDSSVMPTGGINLVGGYVGYTEVPALSSDAFIGHFNNAGAEFGIIGFDQHVPDPGLPRQIGDDINLSGFNSDSSVFIGTATNAELTSLAVITPANNNYQFTGVKGGHLTVDTVLTDNGDVPNSLTLGILTPIESSGSSSVVNLTGNNTFTGGTTINSGTVFISSNTAFGTGPINIPDNAGSNFGPYLASYGGNPITITNPISVGNFSSVQGVSLGNVSPSGNDMLVLSGVISDETTPTSLQGVVAITGPVTLSAANTYSGGTIFSGQGNAEALITNSMSLGSGPITIQDGSTIIPLANVLLANSINLAGSSPLNLGQAGNDFILTLNGSITGYGTLNISSSVTLNASNSYNGTTVINGADVVIGSADSTPFGTSGVDLQNGSSLEYGSPNPVILDLSGDGSSAIAMNPSQVLTLDADSAGGNFIGSINGNGSNSLVKIDTGTQYLYGTATYGGGTSVEAGTLIAGGSSSLGVGTVTVSSGAQLGVVDGAVLSVPITLSGNSTLIGSGTFSPGAAVTFSAGDAVMPGFGVPGQYVATLSFGNSVVFGTDGIYDFNIATASGTPGVDYSTLAIGGSLTINSNPGSPFQIFVNSIDPGSGAPGMANFNSGTPYTWTILTAGSGITGFNPTNFSINAGGFQNSLGGGSFSVAESGNSLTLDFTPVPEPSTWALMLSGIAAAGAGFRRRRRATTRISA